MEPKRQLTLNGQELQIDDVNFISAEAAMSDDRVLWELLRTIPADSGPQKGILTYGRSGWAAEGTLKSTALVQGGVANGQVKVMPFRAVIGSVDLSTQTEDMRGIRSGYLIGAAAQYTALQIAVNSTGDPRWTLIYAAVTPATAAATEVRYAKDTTTKVVGPNNVVLDTSCAVTVGMVNGTAAATPARPALPADAAGTYYLALAYIWVPDGFGALSIVARNTIHEVAPCLTIHSALGVSAMRPASGQHAEDGAVVTNQEDATQQYRPGAYLPATMVGGEDRVIQLQLTLAPVSHLDGDVVDESVDWRFRMFTWEAECIAGNTQTAGFASDRLGGGTGTAGYARGWRQMESFGSGGGQSFKDDSGTYPFGVTFAAIANCGGVAMFCDREIIGNTGPVNSAILLYVDSVTGVLKLKKSTSGTPGGQWRITLRATAPYSNFGVLP